MKALGIVRKMDDLGRLVIPMEVRRSQGWADREPMEMFVTEEGLMIRPYRQETQEKEIVSQLAAVAISSENEEVKKIMQKAIEFIKKA